MKQESFAKLISHFDERIKRLNEAITLLNISTLQCAGGVSEDTYEHCKLTMEKLQNDLRIYEIRKMIVKAHYQGRTATLPLLFQKYTEKTTLALELREQGCRVGFIGEGSYLDYCNGSRETHELFKQLCNVV